MAWQTVGAGPHAVRSGAAWESPGAAATLAAIAALVAEGGVCVLSGAGISTESGIPDYRGPDGARRVQPMTYGEFTGSLQARRRYWSRAFIGWEQFASARPNDGHRAVVALERHGLVDMVITQNVDELHQRAGSRRVVDLHGTLRVVRCLTCGDRVPREEVQRRLAAANPLFRPGTGPGGSAIPELTPVQPDGDVALPDAATDAFTLVPCLRCGADTLKPDVVYFGESVPKDRVARCYAAVDACRTLLVLGSSLAVMSGYRFVRRADKAGIPVAVITRGTTRGRRETTHHLDAPLGGSLSALLTRIGLPAGSPEERSVSRRDEPSAKAGRTT